MRVEHEKYKNLYYLSAHFLDNPQTVQFGQGRVRRDILELWLAKKLKLKDETFDDSEVRLTDEDSGQNGDQNLHNALHAAKPVICEAMSPDEPCHALLSEVHSVCAGKSL